MKRHTITVAALGPDSGDMLACGVYDALKTAPRLLLRTAIHGVADRLKSEGIAFETLDALYEQTEDFDELCELAVKKIIELARQEETLFYAVSEPQNDATVRLLAQKLPEDVELCVLSGMTLADAAACAVIPFGVNTENLRTLTALSALDMRMQADQPQVITELDNRYLASDVKLWLGDLLDDETTVYFLENAAELCPKARAIVSSFRTSCSTVAAFLSPREASSVRRVTIISASASARRSKCSNGPNSAFGRKCKCSAWS